MTKKKDNKRNLIIGISVVAVIIIASLSMWFFSGSDDLEEGEAAIPNCGEGTVIYDDDELCWQKSTSLDRLEDWTGAKDYCEQLLLGGSEDWRLPQASELASIVVVKTTGVSIDEDYFTDTKATHYWTASKYVKDGLHYYTHFELGHQGFAQDFNEYPVRCVRDLSFYE